MKTTNKYKKILNVKSLLYASALLNIIFIVGIVSLWIIISGAGTNRFERTIVSYEESYNSSQFCTGPGYSRIIKILNSYSNDNDKQRLISTNFFVLSLCGNGYDNPDIQKALSTNKFY